MSTARCAITQCANTDLPLVECHYPDGDDAGIYCSEHMPDCFCIGCGVFSAGIESFDFPVEHGLLPGYCDCCSDMIRTDAGELDLIDDSDVCPDSTAEVWP
ncbi:MAG: hypothetical protein HUU22_19030 [Phycisphaerae bacterium]|nr:hypothetical protein [Phycisphaerae bacterium]NUQ48112.1 hypothetical protein [Phycisphaerae bacterium]